MTRELIAEIINRNLRSVVSTSDPKIQAAIHKACVELNARVEQERVRLNQKT